MASGWWAGSGQGGWWDDGSDDRGDDRGGRGRAWEDWQPETEGTSTSSSSRQWWGKRGKASDSISSCIGDGF